MDPGGALVRILNDHERLRSRFDAIEQLAKDIADGWSDDIDLVIRVSESAFSELVEHMRWEDEYLAPTLRNAGSWGEDGAARLADDHREQRMMMRSAIERLRDPASSKPLLSRKLLKDLEILRRDMQDEERWVLSPGVFSNEGVGVNVTTG
jgi:hypothetical protein